MQTANLIIGIALIVMAVFLVIAVLMQHGKDHRLSGSIAGGAASFFGKSKGKTMDAMFSKLTTVVTIIFVILVVVLFVIQPDTVETLPIVDDAVAGDVVTDDTAADDGVVADETVADETVADDADVENADVENTDVDTEVVSESDANTDADTAEVQPESQEAAE